jgi:hypothetical protein
LPIIDRTCFLSGSIALAVAATFALAPPARAEDPHSVFFIQRNKNKNEVHYAISLDENCRPKGDEPVKNYWLRLEGRPERRKVAQAAPAGGIRHQEPEGDRRGRFGGSALSAGASHQHRGHARRHGSVRRRRT